MRSVSIAASAAALFAALAAAAPSPLVVRSTSLDGSCGNAYAGNNQGHSCPTGMCCSEYGWCGTETDHCGAGCQSAFGGCGNVVVTPPVVISPDWTCGGEKGYTCPEGYCCSEYGWCGTGAGFCDSLCNPLFGTCDGATPSPVVTPPTTPTVAPTSAAPTAAPTGIISPDWTCGPAHNNYVCPTGYCCSEYGYCGTGVGYCDSSCNPLFGGCDGASSTPVSSAAPSPTPSVIISPDFTCGGTNGYTCPDNLCCSEYGWCGTGAGFCDAACQPLFGNCDNKSPTATATAPTTTATGAYTPPAQRPTPGSIPYGVNVFSCNVPGVVALTYDDGPFHYTAELLDILAQYNAKATFFVNALTWDGRIDDAAKPWPATMARMIAEGHQVGSHTYSHADMSIVDEPEKVRQMVDLETAFVSLIGRIPTYMRPPYLSCDAGCQNIMTRLGYHIIDTDLDTKDWDHNTAETNYLAQERVTNAIAAKDSSTGSFLVLNHDVHPTTVQILTPFMLEEFQAAGYRFVTVGECLGDPAANWYRSA